METENLISIIQFCNHHNIEHAFIHSLNEHELIELISVDGNTYIHTESIEKIEKIIRLHLDLSINIEGIDVILQLLKKNEMLQNELEIAKRKIASMGFE